jgi:hypothetical protein
MQNVRLYGAAALVSMAFASSASMAAENGKGSFAIRVTVPEYCEIDSDPVVLSEGDGYRTGSVLEMCNGADGFQVAASYRQLSPTESVRLNYAGSTRQLNATGWTPVANRMGAKYGIRPIGVQYADLETPLAINLTITYF